MTSHFHCKHHDKISDIADIWQKCAHAADAHSNNTHSNDITPFLNYHFLHSLEITNCLSDNTGWYPHHLVLYKDDAPIGVMPLYLKTNSYGEYVFDNAWAHAWQQAGGQYYPKILSAIPFTPITGERFLIAPDYHADKTAMKQKFLPEIIKLTNEYQLSSAHINFLPASDIAICEQENFLIRRDTQFHWVNDGYQSFDDFLNALSSRKRKNIRKERNKIKQDGFTFRALSGDDITAQDWQIFYRFYHNTYARKWGFPYLTQEFFEELHHRMGEQIVLIFAYHDGEIVGGALNFKDKTRLYGRNWGCDEKFPFLHFETCYYQAIDYAIAHKLKYVEAGTQGQHKLDRGYQPVTTYSAHYMNHEDFHEAVRGFIEHETEYHQQTQTMLNQHTPFKVE